MNMLTHVSTLLADVQRASVTLAEMRDEEFAIVITMVTFAVVMLAISLAVQIVVCILLIKSYQVVPDEHKRISTGKIWLLLIPFFNLYWVFVVFLRIPESYQSYFASVGRADEFGDCGYNLGKWYAICVLCSIVPCVNYAAGPAALVLLVLFLVKMFGLKAKVAAPATAAS